MLGFALQSLWSTLGIMPCRCIQITDVSKDITVSSFRTEKFYGKFIALVENT
jgi:hypothetical protein